MSHFSKFNNDVTPLRSPYGGESYVSLEAFSHAVEECTYFYVSNFYIEGEIYTEKLSDYLKMYHQTDTVGDLFTVCPEHRVCGFPVELRAFLGEAVYERTIKWNYHTLYLVTFNDFIKHYEKEVKEGLDKRGLFRGTL